jgi:hypothetical protein
VEKNLVDFTLSFNSSNGFFKISNIPEVQNFVLTTSGQIFGVGGNSNSVDLSVVRLESVSNLEIGIPDFKSSIPAN